MLAPFPRAELQGAQQPRHLVQFLQMTCKFSIMAIRSFCHLEEPVPQNNDLKKAHLFARKSLHLGISTDATQRCFFKPRLFQQICYFPGTTAGTRIKLGFCQRTESCI